MKKQTISLNVDVKGKNIVIAYILWWFLGGLGVHRFYLGRIKTGVAQLLLLVIGIATSVFVVGYVFLIILFIWWALDAYFTYKMVSEENSKLGLSNSIISITTAKSSNNSEHD